MEREKEEEDVNDVSYKVLQLRGGGKDGGEESSADPSNDSQNIDRPGSTDRSNHISFRTILHNTRSFTNDGKIEQ
eukprot:3660267-Karenia_brevis.AAC.1